MRRNAPLEMAADWRLNVWQTFGNSSSMPPSAPNQLVSSLLPDDVTVNDVCEESAAGASVPYANMLATVKLRAHPYFLLHTNTGYMQHLRMSQIEYHDHQVELINHRMPHTPQFLLDESRLVNITSSPHDLPDPYASLLLTTPTNVYTARATPTSFKLHTPIPVSSVISSCINPDYPEHISLLSPTTVYSAPIHRLTNPEQYALDIQPLHPQHRYTTVHHGVHPQSLLFSNTSSLALFDIRSDSIIPFVNIHSHLNHPSYATLSTFAPLHAFTCLLLTSTSLLLTDLRRPDYPLLDWSFSTPTTPDILLCEPLDHETYAIAVASKARDDVNLFQLHATNAHLEQLPTGQHHLQQNVKWTDAPIALSASGDTARCIVPTGMVLLPQVPNLFLCSTSELGLSCHTLDITTQPPSNDLPPPSKSAGLWGGENVVRMNNFLQSHSDWLQLQHVKPVTQSVGSVLMSRTRMLFKKDALDMRHRIMPNQDEECDPRPFMSDIIPEQDADETDHAIHDIQDIFDHTVAGCTIDQISHATRAGFCHSPSPMHLTHLKDALQESPFVDQYPVAWHVGCQQEHAAGVSTDDDLPEWVPTVVYCKRIVEVEEKGLEDNSDFGKLLKRMKTMFFEDESLVGGYP